MPYPSEHACRIKDPEGFQPDSFRRVHREHEGKQYDCVMGRMKGEDTMTEQSYRYPADTWTEAEARRHCKEHNGILFEPATGEGEAEEASEACCGGDAQQPAIRFDGRSIRRSRLLEAFTRMPWSILPERLTVLQEIIARHISGEKLPPEEVQLVIHGAKRPDNRRAGNIAILPLFGTIFPRANLMTEVSGATSAELFGKQFDELVKDPEIGAIVLDVDSPGGQVTGVEELSRKIYEARGKKPIVAVANHTMASAAYWIGTAADEVVITPSGDVGSIGAFAAHWDESKALEMEGLKLTLISEGKYKIEGNPYEPLSEEAHSAIRGMVREAYDMFVKAVARNRGKPVDEVRNGFGEGRVVGARQSIELGMADRIGTMEETVKQLQRRLYKLSKEEAQRAEALRTTVNQILEKEKQND